MLFLTRRCCGARFADAIWRRSYYAADRGHAVEVAELDGYRYAVRDGENPTGPVLVFDQVAWDAFIGGAQKGEFAL